MRRPPTRAPELAFAAALLAAGIVFAPAGAAQAEGLELFERAVLPTTSALPTCACAVPLEDGDQLVIGLADGDIVAFHESAGNVIPRTARLPGGGPVDDIIACRVGRAVGSPNEFALLALRGLELFSIGFGDMSVSERVTLPAPSGRYRLVLSRTVDGGGDEATFGADHPVLVDDDTAMSLSLSARSLEPSVETVLEDAPGLVATALSDRVVVVAGSRIIEFPRGGGMRTQIDERTDLTDESLRVVVGGWSEGGTQLELRVSDPDSIWVTRRVAAPAPISTVASYCDSLIVMGGTMALTPDHDIGWMAVVDRRGRIIATGDHASPVTNISRVSGFIAVQGDGRNLSVYDLVLEPLWDHDSPVVDATLIPGRFVGEEDEDLAVVGTRMYRVSAADVDSIRHCLDAPDFMSGAVREGGTLTLERAFATYCVSNEAELRTLLEDGESASADAFADGRVDEAVARAREARAAAAVLRDREGLRRLSSRIHEYVSFPARRRSLLVSALVLLALGAWVSVEAARRTARFPALTLGAVLLLVTGAWAWKLIGDAGVNSMLLLGGVVASASVARKRMASGPVRRVSGAAIEDLIRTLMEFLHGAGEGVPSDGVADTARKAVTKVAYLAQEMVDSMDDEDRYAMLSDRLRSRGRDFLDTTHPRVAMLLTHARKARFIVHEAEQMSAAAERMRLGIATILSETAPEAPMLKHQLQTIKEGRDQLATAADRAWAIVQTNPGCSLVRAVDRILMEKEEELEAEGVRANVKHGVPEERDAVALWSFEFRFILENLVTNALRAMHDSKDRKLTIETSTDGETCSIRVTDTGSGMDEATAASLFDAKPDERDGGYGMPNSRLKLREKGGDLIVERTAAAPDARTGTTMLITIPHWTPNTGETDV